MPRINSNLQDFSDGMSKSATSILNRSICFLYFHFKKDSDGVTLNQIINDFKTTKLGNPNSTRLRNALLKDRRVMKLPKDLWQIKSDKITGIEKQFRLDKYLEEKLPKQPILHGSYINKNRFNEIKKLKSKFDLTRLIKMLSELDSAFEVKNYISVILLVRAILDHIPPVFGFNTFSEFSNNYSGAKSFKESMLNLENSSRKIADNYLHVKIRNKEILPNSTQVNFSNDLDMLLAEIVRIN